MLLYIHFPFCRSKCAYCDFTSYANCGEALVFSYLIALNREIAFASERFAHSRIDTVYLGGGTPSLLSPKQIEGLFAKLRKSFPASEFSLKIEEMIDGFFREVAVSSKIGYSES